MPELPADVRANVAAAGAPAVLLTAIETQQRCSSDSVGGSGVYVQTGTVSCREGSVRAYAFLFAANGDVIWKSYLQRTNETGDPTWANYEGMAEDLLKQIPVRKAVDAQHP